MKLAKRAFLALGFGLALQVTAHAAIVSQWNYTTTSIWTSASPGVTVTPTVLSWGTDIGNGQSTLTIANPAPGVVTTQQDGLPLNLAYAQPGSTITHDNNAITDSPMTGATLNSQLVLNALPGPGANTGPTPINLNIRFLETTNALPCPATSPAGNPCNDIFVLTTPLQNQTFQWDSDGLGGDAPVTYFVNIFPLGGLGPLQDGACDAVFGDILHRGCIGFTTPENAATPLPFAFIVSTTPFSVPEPDAIALTGLALMALALVRRRHPARSAR